MTVVPVRPVRALLAAVAAASALLTGCLFSPGETNASRGMELALQDDATFLLGGTKVSRESDISLALRESDLRLFDLVSGTALADMPSAA